MVGSSWKSCTDFVLTLENWQYSSPGALAARQTFLQMWLPEDVTVKAVFAFLQPSLSGGAVGAQWVVAHRHQLHVGP